jgi:hypothetical protein
MMARANDWYPYPLGYTEFSGMSFPDSRLEDMIWITLALSVSPNLPPLLDSEYTLNNKTKQIRKSM